MSRACAWELSMVCALMAACLLPPSFVPFPAPFLPCLCSLLVVFFLGLCAAKRRNKVVAACRLKTISAGSSISICRLPIARDARPLPPPLPLPRPQHSCTRRRRRRRSLINTELVGNSISNTRPLMDWLPVCLLTPLCPPLSTPLSTTGVFGSSRLGWLHVDAC